MPLQEETLRFLFFWPPPHSASNLQETQGSLPCRKRIDWTTRRLNKKGSDFRVGHMAAALTLAVNRRRKRSSCAAFVSNERKEA